MPGPRSVVAPKRWFTSARRGRGSRRCLCIVAWLAAVPLLAQQPAPSQPYVLHVYTNLMQVPALVLDTEDRPFKHVDTARFAIRLGDGPKFPPAYVRLQGDDPISLSILLDLSGDINDLVPALREAIPALAPDVLHARDHISVYAVDCDLIRTADDLPASRAMLSTAIDHAIDDAGLHGRKKKTAACGDSVPLVNALALIARPLARLPGRRVILVLSNGHDGKSNLKWSQVRQFSAGAGISIFGMTYRDSEIQNSFAIDSPTTEAAGDIDHAENPFGMLCDLTGGIALSISSDHAVSRALPHFVDMLRGRYILEFHRPRNAKPGSYTVNVSLDHAQAHIRVGGTTVHVASAAELATPEIAPAATPTDTPGKVPPPDAP
jgi:hypothetical protein